MGVKLREKTMKDGSSSLYLDIYHEGKRKYDFLNIHLSNKRKFSKEDKEKRELAEKLRIKKDNELLVQEKVLFETRNTEDNLYTYLKKFRKEENKKNRVWDGLLKKTQGFAKNKNNLSFSIVTEDWIIDFQKYLLKQVSNNTALFYINTLNEFLEYAYRNKVIPHNPFKSITKNQRIKKVEAVERIFLTIEEIKILQNVKTDVIPKQYRQIFLFCCFTGLRWSDVYGLKWENIITLNSNKLITFRQKKTKQYEYMPMSAQAIKFLNEIKKENNKSEYIFYEIAKKVNKGSNDAVLVHINMLLKKWAKQAKINKKLHFHVSRHTFATMSLTHGVDIYTISKLLGHTDIRSTMVYAKLVDEKKKKAVASLPTLNFN